jgi:hypothetical protein
MLQTFVKLATLKDATKNQIKNPDQLCNIYLSKESLLTNLKQAFGLSSPGLARRFYYFLSKGYDLKRIYITDYLVRLWGLAEGTFIERNLFAFQMLDGDRDGFISAADLVEI